MKPFTICFVQNQNKLALLRMINIHTKHSNKIEFLCNETKTYSAKIHGWAIQWNLKEFFLFNITRS